MCWMLFLVFHWNAYSNIYLNKTIFFHTINNIPFESYRKKLSQRSDFDFDNIISCEMSDEIRLAQFHWRHWVVSINEYCQFIRFIVRLFNIKTILLLMWPCQSINIENLKRAAEVCVCAAMKFEVKMWAISFWLRSIKIFTTNYIGYSYWMIFKWHDTCHWQLFILLSGPSIGRRILSKKYVERTKRLFSALPDGSNNWYLNKNM